MSDSNERVALKVVTAILDGEGKGFSKDEIETTGNQAGCDGVLTAFMSFGDTSLEGEALRDVAISSFNGIEKRPLNGRELMSLGLTILRSVAVSHSDGLTEREKDFIQFFKGE